MPRLIQKCGYIRAAGAGRYMKYIATREGVEKLHGRGPVTQPQKELIAKLLTDYPDAKELFEYGDYCGRPTFANASAFIAMALDANAHTMEAGDGYLKYTPPAPARNAAGTTDSSARGTQSPSKTPWRRWPPIRALSGPSSSPCAGRMRRPSDMTVRSAGALSSCSTRRNWPRP